MIDLNGKIIGQLTVIRPIGESNKNGSRMWECLCSCGNLILKSTASLNAKDTKKHCGCIEKVLKKRGPRLDLIGKRFGKLLVIECAGITRGNSSYRYKCLCDCGNYTIVPTSHLNNRNTKSCGCLKVERNSEYNDSGDIQLRRLLKQYISGASRRSLDFKISIEEFKEIINSVCFYCKTPPFKEFKRKDSKSGNTILYNGLDRVDNLLGYTLDNVVPCCEICNRAKSNMKISDFLKYIERIKNCGKNEI